MNIHPIFVHFPIALLTFYTLMEILRLPIFQRQTWWFYTKAVLLIAGTIGGFAAQQTGELAEEAFRGTPTMKLVELHSTYASATLWVFGILAALYVIEWIHRDRLAAHIPSSLQKIWNAIRSIESALFRAPILILAAIAGLCLVTITGALGGALVYGGDVDPVVSFIYNLLYKP